MSQCLCSSRLAQKKSQFSALLLRHSAGPHYKFSLPSVYFDRKNLNCSIEESLGRFAEVTEAARRDNVKIRGFVSSLYFILFRYSLKDMYRAFLDAPFKALSLQRPLSKLLKYFCEWVATKFRSEIQLALEQLVICWLSCLELVFIAFTGSMANMLSVLLEKVCF